MDIYSFMVQYVHSQILVKSHRLSFRKHYESAWKSIGCLVKAKKPTVMSVSSLLEVFIRLFEVDYFVLSM